MVRTLVCLALIFTAVPAAAMTKVDGKSEFLQKIMGKTLRLPLYGITLNVFQNGSISGRAWGRDVSGNWEWDNGYFCRTMYWGQREIPFNCQEVKSEGSKMRFTSDKGKGQTAVFTLR